VLGGNLSIKLQIARNQLGTALDLFIRDKDPFSVQALACGGSEIIEGLASEAKIATLSTHILTTFPDVDMRKIRFLRNQYWNAIKHYYKDDKATARDDDALLADFSDTANDTPLFAGWWDYLMVTKRLPVEAQIFQVWWYATNEDKLNPEFDPTSHRTVFPGINSLDRPAQKSELRRVIERYRGDHDLLADPRTEQGSLLRSV
jgi:hypothetical protein